MVCGRPSSSRVKSSLVRLWTERPSASRTPAKRLTTRTSVEKVVTSWAPSSGDKININSVLGFDISSILIEARFARRARLPAPTNPEPLARMLADDLLQNGVQAAGILGRIA